jgi:hypothetical protein
MHVQSSRLSGALQDNALGLARSREQIPEQRDIAAPGGIGKLNVCQDTKLDYFAGPLPQVVYKVVGNPNVRVNCKRNP